MEFISIRNMNSEEAVRLAIMEYETECMASEQLIRSDFKNEIKEIIQGIKNCGYGKAAVEDGKLLGYLGFWNPWDGAFGKCKGVFSPLGGNAYSGNNRNKLASMLFTKTAVELEQEGVDSYAVCRYAHDEETARSYVMNGFGIRCSDAILKVSEYKPSSNRTSLTIKELKADNKWKIQALFNELTLHLASSPCFMPSDLSEDKSWFEQEEIRVFAAQLEDQFVGYLALREEGENYITTSKSMYNLCGAFVLEDYRPLGIAKTLLDYVVNVCRNEGRIYLGVDCETLNPNALHFWGKYFESYTYSFHRRIDERIHNFGEYYHQYYQDQK